MSKRKRPHMRAEACGVRARRERGVIAAPLARVRYRMRRVLGVS